MTVDRMEDRPVKPPLGSIGAAVKYETLEHPPLTDHEKRQARLRCAEYAHTPDDLWLLLDCLELLDAKRPTPPVPVRPDRDSQLPVSGVRPVRTRLPDPQTAKPSTPRPHIEEWLGPRATEAADDIIALCDQPGMTAQAITERLCCDWRIVSRIAVPHLTGKGWTIRQIAGQLGISDRNVKAQRANHRKRLNEKTVDSAEIIGV